MKRKNSNTIVLLTALATLAILSGLVFFSRNYSKLLQQIDFSKNAHAVPDSVLLPFALTVAGLVTILLVQLNYTRKMRESQHALEYILTHNATTGLQNRIPAENLLQELIDKKRDFTIITIDIEDLKSINDYYSRRCGDMLLKKLAERLQSITENVNCRIFRFTSDEFTLILLDMRLEPNSAELYSLRQLLSEPYLVEENPIFIKTSIGVAVSNSGTHDFETYLSNADLAMYEAKKQGTNKTAFFTEDMRAAVLKKQHTVKYIDYACQHGGFYVVFQPQIDVKTGDIHGYEALARLKLTKGPEERFIPPVDFIPAAEKSGYIAKIGRIITEQTIKHMVAWRHNGFKLHKVSINYSVGQITDKGYVNYLSDLLEENAIPPDLICIEITESLFLANRKQAMELFDQFRAIGVQLALDDFGTGYSSLSYLAYLPISTVKIDKSMIDTYLSQENKSQFIRNIVNLVHSLNMELTVEGIEEEWQYKKICEFGGDHIQGYFFSKPIEADQVESYIPRLPQAD